MRGTRILNRNTSKPHWSTGNQWKSSSPETRYPEVSRREKHEAAVETPRKFAGRLLSEWKPAWGGGGGDMFFRGVLKLAKQSQPVVDRYSAVWKSFKYF